VCQPAAFFRRDVTERYGLLDERLHYCMDYEYWLRLAAGGAHVAYVQQCLAGSRLHSANKTLGSRLKFHGEINHMLRDKLGRVPDRWLTNEAHTRMDMLGLVPSKNPLRFAFGVAVVSLRLSFRWNRCVTRSLLRTVVGWSTGACWQQARSQSVRGLRSLRSHLASW
jgi:hypothetical protein